MPPHVSLTARLNVPLMSHDDDFLSTPHQTSTPRIGTPLKITETQSEDNSFYSGRNSHLDQQVNDGKTPYSAEDPNLAVIKDGIRGKPLTTTNPDPFNENALRKEMGETLRTRYNE